jgi:outer membrane protein OmpA-like peptidoglycan-associated protein
MMNRYLRNAALSLAIAATPTLAVAGGVPHGYPGMGSSPSGYRPDSGGYEHDRDGLMRGAGSGAVLGAIAGGPPGAVAGLVLGGSLGEAAQRNVETSEREARVADLAARNKRLQYELQAAREARQAKQAELARLKREQARQGATSALAMNVLFPTDSSSLSARGRERLATLAATLQDQPGMTVTLVGQADQRGAKPYNQALSERRAIAVRDALVDAGVRPDRLRLRAVGEAQADAGPDDPDGLARDRRVTIDLRAGQDGEGSDQVAAESAR